MARVLRHAFLDAQTLEEIATVLRPPDSSPTGLLTQKLNWNALQVSGELSRRLLSQLEKHRQWQESHPVLLGSWGRGELCAKSDLDVLFCGPEVVVKDLVMELENQGLRLRYRMAEDPKNWSIGVQTTDILSLWRAQGITPESRQQLKEQQQLLFNDSFIKKKILKDILQERESRRLRFDSISNFLEPNIKHGSGGIRDIFQGLVFRDLFISKFELHGYEKAVLDYYLQFFLTLRHKLHFSGYGDILVAAEQIPLAKWFGYSNIQDFMREIQRGIQRVDFYSDWILRQAEASLRSIQKLHQRKLKTARQLAQALKTDASVLSQYQVRLQLDTVFGETGKTSLVSASVRGQILNQILVGKERNADAWMQAVFRSRLIDKLCPRIHRLVGYVQHDQYHRFTADAHLLQACRQVLRVHQKAKILGPLSTVAETLTATDWRILSWVALYHDIAKGLKDRDHSDVGAQWVHDDLRAYGVPAKIIEEVRWLVQNHLQLSIAAFRKNPQDPHTWEELEKLGLTESRLNKLAIFTAIDIQATNPEAWNDWKAKLLLDLVRRLQSKETKTYFQIKKSLPLPLPENIDLQLLSSLPASILISDLKKCQSQAPQPWQVYTLRGKKAWLRYYQRDDHPGLFSELMEKLYSSGCSVQHALVQTWPDFGVYDWFQIQSGRDLKKLPAMLQRLTVVAKQPSLAQFLDIELVSQSPQEWVFSFRGLDQKGLLLAAATEIARLGANITSARVHTWGGQVEDLFHVTPRSEDPKKFLEQLRQNLVVSIK